MKKIALFGTSADPPTIGHRAILKWLSDHYDEVAVWTANNPFKSHQTTLEHRARMLNVLIGSIETKHNNIALRQDLSSHRTLETVEKARAVWGISADFTLVIGSDLPSQIPRWYHIEYLLQQVRLLIVPRPGYPIEEQNLVQLRRLGGKCTIADIPVPAVSSTAYRQHRSSDVVTPPVENYIYQEQLYPWQDR